ncbi:GreA/GreB family elongation factor [Pseudoalteromonas sp. T1lg22]|uniref:GreA/GreB family elongation factor n=1 Tax=Pseudoalteromonas sp. T1lg22 TaxID=2077096 RepID=UPI003FA3BEEF
MRVLAGLECANWPLSRLCPHIKVGSTVVVKHVKTGVKRTLNLVHPHQGSKNGYTLPCSSPLGMSLLGKRWDKWRAIKSCNISIAGGLLI